MDYITKEKVVDWIPIREKDSYKNQYGSVLCVGGNKEMGGAIILSAKAALHSGAGLVTVASASENRTALHAQIPEAMFKDSENLVALARAIKQSDTILLGPGLGRDSDAKTLFNFVLKHIQEGQWLILDADALYFYGELPDSYEFKTKDIILTPHLGEWERISSIPAPADLKEKNQEVAKQLEKTLVLKKARTEVYYQDQIWENTAGNPSMATGGMGDTLAGIITGLLSQYPNKIEAILSAVYIHSAIADELAQDYYVTLPSLISKRIPIFMRELVDECKMQ